MPFPKSVFLHFLPELHKTQGVTEVAPQLLGALDAHRIAAVQFLRNGRVRVTTKTSQSTGMNSLRDPRSCMAMSQYQSLPPTSISVPSLCVTCQWSCPMTMSNVLSSLSVLFTQSFNVSFVTFHPLPTVLVASSYRFVVVFRHPCLCLIFPHVCSILVSPFNVPFVTSPVICLGPVLLGLCLRCKQLGHVARNCTQAWGPSSSSSSPPVSTSSSVPVSTSQSTSSTTVLSTSVSSGLSALV